MNLAWVRFFAGLAGINLGPNPEVIDLGGGVSAYVNHSTKADIRVVPKGDRVELCDNNQPIRSEHVGTAQVNRDGYSWVPRS